MENKFRVSKRYQEKFQKKRMEGMTRRIDLKIKKQFCFLFLKWRNTRILRCHCHSKYWAVKKSILPCSWARRFKIIKIASLPKHIFRWNIIPTKIPARFFMELNKMILKLLWVLNFTIINFLQYFPVASSLCDFLLELTKREIFAKFEKQK